MRIRANLVLNHLGDETHLGSLIVVADTHLGLRSKHTSCEPIYLKNFIDWLRNFERKGESIEVHSRTNPPIVRRILPPDSLMFLGDVIELWDADDRSIYLSASALIESIHDLRSKLLYVVGNHDYLMRRNSGVYPLGNSTLEILPDTYPQQRDRDNISVLEKGHSSYLFLHGHQFDLTFRRLGPLAMLMSLIRDGAEALGYYSWVAFGIFVLFLVGYFVIKLGNIPLHFDLPFLKWPVDMSLINNSFLWAMITTVMGVFALPRFIVTFARPFWNWIRPTRYNRTRTLDGFFSWWNSYSKKKSCHTRTLNIVYGHSHIIDLISIQQAYRLVSPLLKRRLWRMITGDQPRSSTKINLINIPSWVREASQDNEKDVALYIDDEGFEFLGWDSEENRPYLFTNSTLEKFYQNQR